ncbi:hypothetical protein [Exiguobacterium sp. s168]|uniref:hypothetical protein n=1 Tax=Exiguobacterium sp. s168 TaxID=2751194 RepID=UPI000647B7DD|nr:hypothetical protein [Exiguobacterium sp. s168]
MMGVSRPTIVKLEQDSSKLNIALAYALFGSVAYDIYKRIQETETLDPNQYKETGQMVGYLEKIGQFSRLNVSSLKRLTSNAFIALSKKVPTISISSVSLIWNAFNRRKVKKESVSSAEEVGKEMNWSLEAAKTMKEVTLNKLYNDHETLLSISNLKEFSIIAFNEEIEKGEDPDYDLM